VAAEDDTTDLWSCSGATTTSRGFLLHPNASQSGRIVPRNAPACSGSASRKVGARNAVWTASPRLIFVAPVPVCVTRAGGELEQIQFLLGHASVQTTERYIGYKQRFRNAVNDRIGLDQSSRSAGAGTLADFRGSIRLPPTLRSFSECRPIVNGL